MRRLEPGKKQFTSFWFTALCCMLVPALIPDAGAFPFELTLGREKDGGASPPER